MRTAKIILTIFLLAVISGCSVANNNSSLGKIVTNEISRMGNGSYLTNSKINKEFYNKNFKSKIEENHKYKKTDVKEQILFNEYDRKDHPDFLKTKKNVSIMCKENPNSEFCSMMSRLSKERSRVSAGVEYSYTNKDLSVINKQINNAISTKKNEAEKKHKSYISRSKYSPSLSGKWNNVVNSLLIAEASNNNYITYVNNKSLLIRLNEELSDNRAIVTRNNGIYRISSDNKEFDRKINSISEKKSNRDIIPIASKMSRLNKLESKAFHLAKKGYLKNAPLVAKIYSQYKKKVFIISGKKESPKTSNVFGNLYIHEDYLKEISTHGMLNFFLHHEGMHIKNNLLGFDVLRRDAESTVYTGGILDALKGDGTKKFSTNMKNFGSYLRSVTDSSMTGHSESLRKFTYKSGITSNELINSKAMFDIIREISIDREVSNYVTISDTVNYFKGMIEKVSFNNRYRMLIMINKNSSSDLNSMINEFPKNKKYSSLKELYMDDNIGEDSYYDHVLGFFGNELGSIR